jgi:hypothetical protein
MAWEVRGNHSYYYRSRREGGRVVKEYLGAGEAARAIAALERMDRERAGEEARRWRQERARQDAVDALLLAFCACVSDAVTAALERAGYYRHDRGPWRKRRRGRGPGGTPERSEEGSAVTLRDEVKQEKAIRAAGVPAEHGERVGIVQAYVTGTEKQKEKLRSQAVAIVRAHPEEFGLGYGSAVSPIMDLISDGDAVVREILAGEVKAKRAELRAECRGGTPSALEGLLIERVLACWLHLSYYERAHCRAMADRTRGLSIVQAEFQQKRIESAQRRYLSAVKALAQVRRLQLPAVQVALPGATQIGQVNVGEKQINVAGGQSPVTLNEVRGSSLPSLSPATPPEPASGASGGG